MIKALPDKYVYPGRKSSQGAGGKRYQRSAGWGTVLGWWTVYVGDILGARTGWMWKRLVGVLGLEVWGSGPH